MFKNKKVLGYSALLTVLVALIIIKLYQNKVEAVSKVYIFDQSQPVTVLTYTVKKEPIVSEITYPGSFQPRTESRVMSDIPGKIVQKWVSTGDNVEKGQHLLQIDDTLLKLELKKLKIQISGLQNDLERFKMAGEAVEKVKIEKTDQALKTALANESIIKKKIEYSRIKAPVEGIITQTFVNVGNVINPGMPLFQITNLDTLDFIFHLDGIYLPYISEGDTVELTTSVKSGLGILSRIKTINSRANRTGKFTVEAEMVNSGKYDMKSGISGEAHLTLDYGINMITIPVNTLAGSTLEPYVYKIENDTAHLTPIAHDGIRSDKLLIKSGLKEGDVIVSGGFINLYDGAPVIEKVTKGY